MIRAAVINTLRQIGAIPNTIPGPDRDASSGALPPPGAPLHEWNSTDIYKHTMRQMREDRRKI